MKTGVVTFDFPPQYRRADVAARPLAVASPLMRLLRERGVEVTAPLEALAARDPGASAGIRDAKDVEFCVDALRAARVDCLVIDVFHWARIALVAGLVEKLDVPVAAFANVGEGYNGVPCAGAICGSLREAPRTRRAALVEGFLDTDADSLMAWVRGVSALARMRRSRIMLWGGSYGAEMPYTRSDPAEIEAAFIAEVMSEQEELIVEPARRIVCGDHARIEGFLAWLQGHGATVRRDGKMVSEASLDFQVALYLAARDRIAELEKEGGATEAAGGAIAGASIKCHYEMSLTCQGCTGCLLPGFLPFGEDGEGARRVVPFACEGDLNGLVSVVLLHALVPEVPPLFGDLVAFKPDHVLLRNCGGSSVYWAARSADAARALSRVTLGPNLHGKSGAAVGYETPSGGPVTFLRLFRQDRKFAMLLGEGAILDPGEASRYDDPWPHTRLSLGVDPNLLFRAIPCSHGSLTEGRLGREVETACAHAGVAVFRCDGEEGLRELLHARGVRGERE
jgi:L-fucose isomerase-like protein